MRKVLLVEESDIIRDGVKHILDDPPGSFAFGEASSAPAAVRLVSDEYWDATILDLSVGGQSGLALLKELKVIRPSLPVVILSMHSEEQYVRRAFKAGASSYVTKDSSRAELSKAFFRAIHGGRYVCGALAEKLLTSPQEDADRPAHELLSDREMEVLRYIAAGKTIGEIAAFLHLSDKTISTYRSRIIDKLKLETTADIIRYAMRNGLED